MKMVEIETITTALSVPSRLRPFPVTPPLPPTYTIVKKQVHHFNIEAVQYIHESDETLSSGPSCIVVLGQGSFQVLGSLEEVAYRLNCLARGNEDE